jgi:hypothetical protein
MGYLAAQSVTVYFGNDLAMNVGLTELTSLSRSLDVVQAHLNVIFRPSDRVTHV